MMRALRAVLGSRTTSLAADRSAWWTLRTLQDGSTHQDGSAHLISQQRSAVGHSDVEMGRSRGGLDTTYGTWTGLQGRRDDQLASDDEAVDWRRNHRRKASKRRNQENLEPLVLEAPAEDMKLVLGIKLVMVQTIVDWVSGHVKLKTWESTIATAQNLL